MLNIITLKKTFFIKIIILMLLLINSISMVCQAKTVSIEINCLFPDWKKPIKDMPESLYE